MKTILITGASGGIGSAIKENLEAAGHKVLSPSQAEADLSKRKDIEKLKEKILQEVDHIDWIICSHGFIDTETVLEQMTPEHIDATFTINTLSIIYLAQQFLSCIPAGGGIISLSSAAGIQANGRISIYSASKAAVNSFMQAMARNRPEQKFYALCPGPTNTPMRERTAGDASKQQSPDVVAVVAADLVEGKGEYKSGDVILVKNGETSISSRL